jgi:hypothetical protein
MAGSGVPPKVFYDVSVKPGDLVTADVREDDRSPAGVFHLSLVDHRNGVLRWRKKATYYCLVCGIRSVEAIVEDPDGGLSSNVHLTKTSQVRFTRFRALSEFNSPMPFSDLDGIHPVEMWWKKKVLTQPGAYDQADQAFTVYDR